MYWNYRLMESAEREYPDEVMVYITEVFYDENDAIIGWVHPSDYGNSYDETANGLYETFQLMLEAWDKPVLVEKDLPGYKDGSNQV